MFEDSPTCQIHKKYVGISCDKHALTNDPDGLCILHSQDKAKESAAFRKALLAIWEQEDQEEYDFRGVFFPGKFNPKDFFGSREFKKPADFSKATFTEWADFSEVTFTQEADFSWATFTEWAEFSWATFTGWAEFSGATFEKVVYFRETTFTMMADFSAATFTLETFFSEATFNQESDFSVATFKKAAYFNRATFNQESDFSAATFKQAAYFSEATFTQNATFIGATIAGRLIFRKMNLKKKDAPQPPPFIGYFIALEFQDQGLLHFKDLSLANVLFAGTDLRRAEFHHVTWHAYRGRQAIYDEILLRQLEKEEPWFWEWFWTWISCHLPLQYFALESGAGLPQYLSKEFPPPEPPLGDRYGAIERLYRDLQINYESVNDYKTSGDFHYGEMEMYRRASKWRCFPLYWNNLYWLCSGYGERPLRSFLTLVGLILAFSGFFLGVEKELMGGWNFTGFWKASLYVFQQGTLQKPELLLKVASSGGKFLSALMPVLIPGQAALFLLALRNRLGRRR
jgi:uncharacterized protein YjbI with pentapeptide repeats